jgi:adenosine deaminase
MSEPLIELHCHSDGLLDPAMVRELAARGIDPGVDAEALAAHWPVGSLAEWTQRYQPLCAHCLAPPSRRLPLYAAHVRNLVRQGVEYAELMVSGLLLGREEGSAVDRFLAVRRAVDQAAGDEIRVELLACFGRGPLARASAQADQILTVAREGLIAGVALAGDEDACSVRSLAPVLDRLRDAGLGIEIHAGEQKGPESVWDALEHGRPQRIGHGVRAFEDERLLAALRERDVHLELCPTSNLRLGVIRNIDDLPIRRALALGVSFSINTDDPGPFGCTLESEMQLCERSFGLTAADLATIRASAWRARFARGA